MLFDLHPKETAESLYGRDTDLSNLINHLINRRWVALLGTRMIGKTSLVKAARHDLQNRGITSLYINLRGINSIAGFLKTLTHTISESSGLYEKIKNVLSRTSGLNIGPMGITLSSNKQPVNVIRNLLSIIGEHTNELVIILDEVQELRTVSGHLINVLANIFNTYPNITFCFTGSYFGLVKSLLEPKSHSPLYGRSPAKINIYSFSKTISKNFLIAGFQERNVEIKNDDINEVIERFDGVPGWLTFYGNNRTVSGLSHKNALTVTEKESFKIQKSVLKHYFVGKYRRAHLAALRAIAAQATWSEVRGAIEAHTGRKLNDASLKNIIDTLKAAFLIEKNNSIYRVIDPTLKRFLLLGITII